MRKLVFILTIFLSVLIFSSCEKFLDKKSDQRLSTPDTIEDLQAILDNSDVRRPIDENYNSTDEFYIGPGFFQLFGENTQDLYVWSMDANYGINTYNWAYQYISIFQINTVLDNVDKVQASQDKKDAVKGSALFLRSFCFYNVAQLYAKQYDEATAATDLGIVLRLSSDFNVPSVRSTVQETYDQIIKDLNEAANLLPISSQYKTRPSRAAVYALLSRVYLTMGDYDKSNINAGLSLNAYNSLLDFNSLDSNSLSPIVPLNVEVLFYTANNNSFSGYGYPYFMIDSTIAWSYDENDLRRVIYLIQNPDSTYGYKTISNNGDYVFSGLGVNEVYFNRAESYARLGNTALAMQDLNTVLIKRWKTGTFVPLTASSSSEALNIILTERKKELLNRGTRWTDIRRLNKEPQFAITLTRNVDGTIYTLPPNDLRYVFLIPQEVIDRSGIAQNPR